MADNPTTPQNLPADFTDRLSDELLLVPDGEFILARWAFAAALAAQMKEEDGFDLAMMQLREGRVAESGAAANMAEAMSQGMGGPLLLSMGMTYPDMVKMVKEAKLPGEVIKIDRPRFIDGATTEANRKLGPTSKVFGTNSQPIGMDQVDVTIVEYGGPGNAAGDIVPINIGSFAQNRSAHDLILQTGYELRRDRTKFVDDLLYTRALAAAAANSDGVTRGGNVASDAAFTGADNEPFGFETIVRAGEAIKGRKVPGVGGAGRYPMLIDLHQASQLKLDPKYQRLAVFEPQWNPLFPGYMKTVEDVIICVSNRMPRVTNLGAATNITGYQALIVAPNAIGWALARDAKAIRDRNDDGGRFNQFAWNAYEGWKILDERFCQKVVTT